MTKLSMLVIGMTLAFAPACGKDKKTTEAAPAAPAPAAAAAAPAAATPPAAAAPAAAPAPAAAGSAKKADDKGGW